MLINYRAALLAIAMSAPLMTSASERYLIEQYPPSLQRIEAVPCYKMEDCAYLSNYEKITCYSIEDCEHIAKFHNIELETFCNYNNCTLLLERDLNKGE